jgi:hypothetical protein
MSKKREGGVWIVSCDFVDDESGKPCDLGHEGDPAMFVDPDGGTNPEMHFQCGKHHGIVKQSEKKEYQLPEGVEPIEPQGQHTAEDIGVTLEGFKPEVGGKVWDGKEKPND